MAPRSAAHGAISVGVPIYNNGATLRRAVESLLAQTVAPELIDISDNASTDDTETVGRSLAAAHPSVSYTRQPASLGSFGNFAFLLRRASTQYFMWLAADDYLRPTYLEKTSACLDTHTHVATCVSQVMFIDADGTTRPASGGDALRGTVRRNLASYLNGPEANVRVYGLHRTDILRRAFPPSHFHAADWALMAGTLLAGGHEEIAEVLMVRDETPRSSYIRQIRHDNRRAFDRMFPLAPMTRDLLLRQRIPLDLGVIRALLKINLEYHASYTKVFHPLYHKLIGRRIAEQIWRLETARQPA